MAATGFTPIQIYYSTTASAVPTAANLSPGELGLNIADMKLYCENSSGVVTLLAAASGASGDVVGPASAVNNRIALFDGTTGKLIKDGGQGLPSGTIVGTSDSQTLTNKTINGPDNTITNVSLTTAVTGTLPVANGGTGQSSGTSGGVLYFSSSSALASSAALAANALVIGGGAGVAPATTTTGSGVITALGNAVDATGGVVTTNGTATLTNKRVNPRASSAASITSPLAWNSDNFDLYAATAQSGALTISADSGTPVNGQKIIFRFKDNGTARALTWTTGTSKSFQAIGITLPTTTVVNKTTYVGCIYNAADDRWDAVATVTQA